MFSFEWAEEGTVPLTTNNYNNSSHASKRMKTAGGGVQAMGGGGDNGGGGGCFNVSPLFQERDPKSPLSLSLCAILS